MLQGALMSCRSATLCAPAILCLLAFLPCTRPAAYGEILNTKGHALSAKSVRDWQKRRAAIVRAMQEVMGPLPGKEKRCPLDVKVEEEVDCGDYVRRYLTYAAEPGSRVPAYLLIPKSVLYAKSKHKAPAILCLHQTHSLGQKVVVGLGNSTNDEYGVELARRGYVCLAPPYP